ncbi:chromate efflux transporter [Salsuginibacillus kocurii]|uniref:chromate efflux transporter n=1 Tax=Salsuginibacillus kocurii TaxID=427078 RepID=UPI0004768DE1|nr:chromate efflux transporter [Salsuginibacillus kocurii]
MTTKQGNGSKWEILKVSTRLGFTSFGGPVAHLGYFHDEYVKRRKWLDEQSYADLVALSQFLPGPASSQVGIGIGVMRGGISGGLLSFLGFTLPSILLLMIFAFMFQTTNVAGAGWIDGLKLVAVAVVAHAIVGMGKKLAPDKERATISFVTLMILLVWQTVYSQVLLIALAALVGLWLYRKTAETEDSSFIVPLTRRFGAICLGLFGALLGLLPLLRAVFDVYFLELFDSFYRAGALVFGGGHVVLPLLEREMVPAGFTTAEEFLAGYGAAQAVPGPLFTFASYLGVIADGWVGGVVATVAIFLPAFLLILGALPFWSEMRRYPNMQAALFGVNACVVGILAAAFYNPILTSAVTTGLEAAIAVGLFGLLAYWKMPAWGVVIVGLLSGILLL